MYRYMSRVCEVSANMKKKKPNIDISQAESFRNKPWFTPDEKAHGYSGPIITAPHDPAEISNLLLESYQSKGLPLAPDMFTSADNRPSGCGHAVRTIYQGVRMTAADYLTNVESRGKLDIKTHIYVDKVVLDHTGDGLRAVGVDLQDASGNKTSVRARREVILTAGAYGSPTVLLRSGIGEKHEVVKHGVESRINLPGVGKNLMDHLVSREHLNLSLFFNPRFALSNIWNATPV